MNANRRQFLIKSGAGIAGLLAAEVTSASLALASGKPGADANFPGLVPLPAHIRITRGKPFIVRPAMALDDSAARKVGGPAGAGLADYARRQLAARAGVHLDVVAPKTPADIVLRLAHKPICAGADWQVAQAYHLDTAPDGRRVDITAGTLHGLFYGVVTLLNLVQKVGEHWQIPAVEITDWPRFQWRGYMLDVSRHFFGSHEVMQIIDIMALLKLNIFHWHLTDHQGWRLSCKKYPRLTSVGAWRSDVGFGFPHAASTHYNARGQYGGFYTHQDVRDVLAYAAQRHITIVPEIESPGHCAAAVAAYPWLSCSGKPITVPAGAYRPGLNKIIMCAGSPRVYQFMETVIGEVADMFPGPYIHTGGDEVDYASWQTCRRCAALMRKRRLTTMPQLQQYYEARIARLVAAAGKKMICWDFAPPGSLLMAWHGGAPQLAADAAQAKQQVIRCPQGHLYFDWLPTQTSTQKVYQFDPTEPGFTPQTRPFLLGAQANLWTEWVPNLDVVWQRTFPRLCAAAEVFWTPQDDRHWANFTGRLKGFKLAPPRRPRTGSTRKALGSASPPIPPKKS